jgi:thioredoxin 1
MNKLRILYFILFVCAVISAQTTENTKRDAVIAQKNMPPIYSSQHIAEMIVNSKIPVLVDFWASWCGPCKLLNPVIKQLEKDYDKKVMFVKVNVDLHRAIASYFNVSAIPAVFIIKDKSVVKMFAGLQPRDAYVNALNDVLNSAKNKSEKPSPE